MQRRVFLAGLGTGALAVAGGCLGGDDSGVGAVEGETLTLTTTTSTYDTGLLGTLNEGFEDRFGVEVATVARGTGAALRIGRNGDCDVVLVHARSLEDEFISEGYGTNRRDVMYNDFVIVGPASDPAGVSRQETATDAFLAIADTGATFVSRGDDSGTHQAERDLWDAAGFEPDGEWYREVGSGMGEVLTQAALETDAYTLTDRGTYLSMRSSLDLDVLLEGSIEGGPSELANPYGIVAVNPAVHEHVAYDLAMAYIGFLTSPAGRDRIASHTVDGKQLFYPSPRSENPNFEQYVPEGWTPSDEVDDRTEVADRDEALDPVGEVNG